MYVRKRDVASAIKLMSRMESGDLPAPHAGCMSAMLTLYSSARNADKVKELSSKIILRDDCKEPEYHSVLRYAMDICGRRIFLRTVIASKNKSFRIWD